MKFSRVRFALVLPVAVFGLAARVPALINLDGTRNQIFVSAGVSFGWDSNVFSESDAQSDFTHTSSASIQFKRRAGIIGVDASMGLNLAMFEKYTSENSLNPTFSLELDKSTGRTTGALTINPYRESRSDSAVNIRTQSWNFPIGLNLKYPINDRYYLSSSSSYLSRQYQETATLVDYTEYSEGLNLFYVFTSKLDLTGSYRLRVAETSAGTHTDDHSFSIGATGGILPKLNGTVNIGYQFREASSMGARYDAFSTSSSVTWVATRKFNLKADLSRDFTTTATATTVDTFGGMLTASYVFSRKLEATASAGYGRNRFLGTGISPRTDRYFRGEVGASYSLNEHFKIAGSYSYMYNWSTLDYSEFARNGCSISLSSHY